MRIIYVVTHFFPSGRVGSRRANKMVKYLRRYGGDVGVVCLKEEEGSPEDLETDREVNRDVTRVTTFPVGAIRHLYKSVRKERKNPRPVALVISGPPFGPFLLGPLFRVGMGVPYVLDYRDEWSIVARSSRRPNGLWERLRHRLLRVIESLVLSLSHGALFANAPTMKAYVARTSVRRPETIENGLDLEDLHGISPSTSPQKQILLSGKLFSYDPTSGHAFFRAIVELRKQRSDFEVIVLSSEPEIAEDLVGLDLGGVVKHLAYVPYRKALQYTAQCHFGVCLTPDAALSIGTKIFEYAALSKPVIFLKPEWPAIEDSPLKDAVEVHCVDGRCVDAILDLMTRLLDNPPPVNRLNTHRGFLHYSRAKGAERLFSYLGHLFPCP